MRGQRAPDLRRECERLRTEERLSYSEISERTGVAQGSLSEWLRHLPLTRAEITAKRTGRTGGRTKSRGVESKFHKIVSNNELSRSQKNKIAEAAVLYRLVLYGFEVFGSVFDGDKTDWLVRAPGSSAMKRIEVKWASHANSHGLPVIPLVCVDGHNKQRRYRNEEFDALVVL